MRFASSRWRWPLAAGLVGLFATAAATLGTAQTVKPKAVADAAAPFPFADYDALLKKYVDEHGRVDYAALKRGDAATVERLYAALAATGPDKTPALYPGRPAALAYYLSAYNLLIWKNVLDSLPGLKQVDEQLYRFFRQPKFQVDGQELNLDELEKKLIRPRFRDGRVHFALNCASAGCPTLPRDAFTPALVEQQLDREARRFINEPRNVRYAAAQRTVTLSMIFKWYGEDFAPNDRALLDYLNRFRTAEQQLPSDAKLTYVGYDWRLNDRTLPTQR